MKIYVGTSGYGYKEWKGKFYPEKISPKAMLRFYGEHFNAVEINYTYYHMPTERVLKPWTEQVPGDFAFALKAPQVITHLKQLRDVGEETGYFLKTLSVLDQNQGPALFQFPKSFHAKKNLSALEEFLPLIPVDAQCAFNFRSPTWIKAGVADLLRERGCGLCIEDTDEKVAGEIVTAAQWGYLRLRRSDYSDADLSQWAEKILAQQWDKVFVFFKHEDEAKGPEYALRFRRVVTSGS